MFYIKLHSEAFDMATHFSYDKVSGFNLGYSKVTSRHFINGFRLCGVSI